jgi:signal transduction histidine kinase
MQDAHRTPSSEPTDDAGPESLGFAVLVELVRAASDGVAVLDADRRYLYVNPAGSRLLGKPARDLVGQRASFPADGSDREIAHAKSAFTTGTETFTVVTFRDVTESRRQEQRLAAFAGTAARIAYSASLQSALDHLAAEVVRTTAIAACTIVLIHPDTHAVRLVGKAGYPDDYADRMEACRRLGAKLVTFTVFETRQRIVQPGRKDEILADPRMAPFHDIFRDADFGTLVAFPLMMRDELLGVFTGFYTGGHHPSEADIAFLTGMVDQAAIAVQNSRLLTDVEDKAALEERHRIARELHDSISQALFSMTLHTRALELAAQRSAPADDRLTRGLAELRELTQGALAEMRALIFQLRPDALRDEGLVEAVRKHAAAVAARAGLTVRITAPDDDLDLDEQVELELLRIVQEALHNVVRHARADTVRLRLGPGDEDAGTLVLEITDDGVGFDGATDHPGHLGLKSMRERTERLCGRLTITSAPGRSTTVRAVLPGLLATRREMGR